MTETTPIVLAVGASGSIGRQVVAESLRRGHRTRALVRHPDQASLFPAGTEVVVGDPTRPEDLTGPLEGVTGVVLTQGTFVDDLLEDVNYGVVRNVVTGLDHRAHIALMTALGVTVPTPGHDWKRRGERLVRASGLPCTVVRPGWFDANGPGQQRLVMRQGDTHRTGSPADGAVSRRQIAEVLVTSLTCPAAEHRTLELATEQGPQQADLEPLFAALRPDTDLDGPLDPDTLPLADEPEAVRSDLAAVRDRFRG